MEKDLTIDQIKQWVFEAVKYHREEERERSSKSDYSNAIRHQQRAYAYELFLIHFKLKP